MASLRAWLVDIAAFSALSLTLACGGGDAADPANPGGAESGASASEPAASPVPRALVAPAARADNAPPRILSARFDPERPTPGSSVRVVAETEDPDGDSVWLQYAWWLDGERLEGLDTPRLLLQDARKGARLAVEIVASDGKDRSLPLRLDSEVHNSIPEIGVVKLEPETVIAGDVPIAVRPEASDADGDRVSFSFLWKVNGRRVDETGSVLQTSGLRRGDRVSVAVTASDGYDESEPYELPAVRVANAAPRILSTPGGEPTRDGPFYQIRAEDPDGDQGLQYAIEDAPAGMTVDARTGAIDWTPTPEQVGTHTISVIVDDLQGGRSRQTIQVSVGEVGAEQPPARSR